MKYIGKLYGKIGGTYHEIYPEANEIAISRIDRLKLLNEIKSKLISEYDSYIEAKAKLDPTTLNDCGYWGNLLGKIEVTEKQLQYINEYIRHINDEEKNT